VYKILAKVLALRLRKGVGKIVIPNQHAFIHGRQILDASLIVNDASISTSSQINQVSFASSILRRRMTTFLGVF